MARHRFKSTRIYFSVALITTLLILSWTALFGQLPAASFHHLKRDEQLLSSNFSTIAEDQYGFIWFGSYDGGGLYRYDGYEVRSFLPDPSNIANTLSGPRIATIDLTSDSLVFVGTTFGFSFIDLNSGDIQSFNNQLDSLVDVRVGGTWAFAEDTIRHVYWIGTRYGLLKFDRSDKNIIILRPGETSVARVVPEDIIRIIIDPLDRNKLWLGTYKGLFSYSISDNEYQYYQAPSYVRGGLVINNLIYGGAGVLYVATRHGSVLSYDAVNNSWQVLLESTLNGVDEQPAVFGIMHGFEDELWICTQMGVGRFTPGLKQPELWQYDPALPDGLLRNNGYRNILGDRHGRLWITSWHGVQYAKQQFVPPSGNVQNLRVAITDVDISPGYETDPEPLLYRDALQLRKDQREITIHYVLPNPMNPGDVKYRYMLKGFDSDFIETNQRAARYPRLSGGDYQFLVQGKEGGHSEWTPMTSLKVVIPKKITEFWWFWTVAGLLIAIIAVLIYRTLIARARSEERMKAEFESRLSEIEMQALRAQMNPHFLFNSLNSIKYFAISKSKDETAAYLSKFAMLVRAILNNSKSRTISLKDELDALRLYIEIEHLRLEGRFDYTIDIDTSIHIGQAQIPPMILQPYVENALWHGLMHKEGRGRLLVQVKDLGNQIQCIIEDNGIGRAKAAELKKSQLDHKKSVGMKITSDRIALINKIYDIDTQVYVIDLADSDGNPSGTRVVINIPLIGDEEE